MSSRGLYCLLLIGALVTTWTVMVASRQEPPSTAGVASPSGHAGADGSDLEAKASIPARQAVPGGDGNSEAIQTVASPEGNVSVLWSGSLKPVEEGLWRFTQLATGEVLEVPLELRGSQPVRVANGELRVERIDLVSSTQQVTVPPDGEAIVLVGEISRVTVHVVDQQTRPLEGATVWLRPQQGARWGTAARGRYRAWALESHHTVSDRLGTATFDGIYGGAVEIAVALPGFISSSTTMRASSAPVDV